MLPVYVVYFCDFLMLQNDQDKLKTTTTKNNSKNSG